MTASNDDNNIKIILTNLKNWKKWYWDLQINVNDEIWQYIDSEAEELDLLEWSEWSVSMNFDRNALMYAALSTNHQKTYDNAHWYFDQDMKYYSQQHEQLSMTHAYIIFMVFWIKKIILNPTLSVHEWLVKLKNNTELAKRYMIRKIVILYSEVLKSLKDKTFSQWLNRWENAMKKEIKYSITKVQNARWLADLTQAVQLLSQSYFEQLLENTENDDKTDFSNYLTVTRKLHKVFGIWKSMSTDHIMRESTFNVTFETEKSEKNSDTLTNSGR